MTHKRLGQRLRAARKAFGDTQTQCSKRVKVSFQMIQKYELGICRVPVDKLAKLAKVYGFSLDDIVKGLFTQPTPNKEKR